MQHAKIKSKIHYSDTAFDIKIFYGLNKKKDHVSFNLNSFIFLRHLLFIQRLFDVLYMLYVLNKDLHLFNIYFLINSVQVKYKYLFSATYLMCERDIYFT